MMESHPEIEMFMDYRRGNFKLDIMRHPNDLCEIILAMDREYVLAPGGNE